MITVWWELFNSMMMKHNNSLLLQFMGTNEENEKRSYGFRENIYNYNKIISTIVKNNNTSTVLVNLFEL